MNKQKLITVTHYRDKYDVWFSQFLIDNVVVFEGARDLNKENLMYEIVEALDIAGKLAKISELEKENQRLTSVLMHIAMDSQNENEEDLRECAYEGFMTGLDYTGEIDLADKLKALEELLSTPRMLKLYSELNTHCGTMMGVTGGMLLQVRGWGHLCGKGACALPENEAAEIQDEFSAWLVRLLNHVKGKTS